MNYFPLIAGAVLMALILVPLHSWDVYRIEAKQEQAIKDQVTFDIKQCDKNTKPAIVSDSNEVKTLTDNLNTCLGKLSNTPTCVPIIKHTCGVKTTPSTASRPADFGLTSSAIDAHNIFCDQQIDSLNSAKTWAVECLKNGTCQ